MKNLEIPISELRNLLRYDPESGTLTWLYRPRMMFNRDRIYTMWNTRFAEKAAFTSISQVGYHHGKIHSITYQAHRVVWALHHGVWPTDQIDHINGIRTDNRIVNLREVNNSENQKNARIPDNNTSGYIGVCWHKLTSKWQAQITVDGERIKLGLFDNLHDAVAARTKANQQYGFHEGHGRS
jgi:hypothetical protein